MLLYRMKMGYNVNLGERILKHLENSKNRGIRGHLILPSTIFTILQLQGIEVRANDVYHSSYKSITVTKQLLETHDRICDLPWVDPEVSVNMDVEENIPLPTGKADAPESSVAAAQRSNVGLHVDSILIPNIETLSAGILTE